MIGGVRPQGYSVVHDRACSKKSPSPTWVAIAVDAGQRLSRVVQNTDLNIINHVSASKALLKHLQQIKKTKPIFSSVGSDLSLNDK